MRKIVDPWILLASIEKSGTLAKASKDLGLTLSTASKAITDLEKRFELTLLDRTRKPAVLTDSAYKLLPAIKAKISSDNYLFKQITDLQQKEPIKQRGRTLRLSLPNVP